MAEHETSLPHGSSIITEKAKNDPIADLAANIKAEKSTYCCGGSIGLKTDDGPQDSAIPLCSSPVIIRWDDSKSDSTHKVELPLKDDTHRSALEQLINGCAPATFGYNGKEVLDETYRLAAKLDNSRFCTTFNPYIFGIINGISQALVPSIAKSTYIVKFKSGKEEVRDASAWPERHSVMAELYKLNIYSAPSGKFKSHVDTPRSATQFGSLVVCLPSKHQGGQLQVSHHGEETSFDFSEKSSDTIQWAAFYSDAEHEILEVTSGHRITLTYNLFVQERMGALAYKNPVANPESYALFKTAKDTLERHDFLAKGGTIGFFCRHAYAHSDEKHISHLPYALKGTDLIIHSIFRQLGLDVKIRPILDMRDPFWEMDSEDDMDDEDNYDSSGEYIPSRKRKDRKPPRLVGSALHNLMLDDQMAGDDYMETVQTTWPSTWRKQIHWLNEQGPKELAMVQLTWGNEPGMGWNYSHAAIIINVPTFEERHARKQGQGDK